MTRVQEHKLQLSAEEYMALEEQAEYKSEYYNREIFPIAGGATNHRFLRKGTPPINRGPEGTPELRSLLAPR